MTPTRWALVGYLVFGWIVALVIPVLGNYQLTHRLAGAAELGAALILATLIGPFIALALAYMVGRIG